MSVRGVSPSAALDSPEADAAIRSLTALERAVSRRLIARQFRKSPHTQRVLDKYGIKGTVQLYSATAMRLYVLVLAPPLFVLAALGQSAVVGAMFAVAVILTIATFVRLATASRSGRKWRASRALTADGVGAKTS